MTLSNSSALPNSSPWLGRRTAGRRRWFRPIGCRGITYRASGPTPSDRHAATARRVDPIPLVFGPDDWQRLHDGIAQRVRLLELVAADLYGRPFAGAAGLLPVDAVLGSPLYRLPAHGWSPTWRRACTRYAADITRDASGRFLVVEDHTENPVGAGRALLLRSVLTRLFGVEHRRLQRPAARALVRCASSTLAELVPAEAPSPRVALLAPAAWHPDFTEQALLATQLGYNLVDAGDLAVHGGSLYLRADERHGTDRRVAARHARQRARPAGNRATDSDSGVAGLVQSARRGRVGLSNAVGSGLVGGTHLHRYLPRSLLGVA